MLQQLLLQQQHMRIPQLKIMKQQKLRFISHSVEIIMGGIELRCGAGRQRLLGAAVLLLLLLHLRLV